MGLKRILLLVLVLTSVVAGNTPARAPAQAETLDFEMYEGLVQVVNRLWVGDATWIDDFGDEHLQQVNLSTTVHAFASAEQASSNYEPLRDAWVDLAQEVEWMPYEVDFEASQVSAYLGTAAQEATALDVVNLYVQQDSYVVEYSMASIRYAYQELPPERFSLMLDQMLGAAGAHLQALVSSPGSAEGDVDLWASFPPSNVHPMDIAVFLDTADTVLYEDANAAPDLGMDDLEGTSVLPGDGASGWIAYDREDGNIWLTWAGDIDDAVEVGFRGEDGSILYRLSGSFPITDEINEGQDFWGATWSHDGTMLAFRGDSGGNNPAGIWLYRDGQLSVLPNTEGCAYPAFSADNQRLFYTCWFVDEDEPLPVDDPAENPGIGFLSSSAIDGSDQRNHIAYPPFVQAQSVDSPGGAALASTAIGSVAVRPSDGTIVILTANTGLVSGQTYVEGQQEVLVYSADFNLTSSFAMKGSTRIALAGNGEYIVGTLCAFGCSADVPTPYYSYNVVLMDMRGNIVRRWAASPLAEVIPGGVTVSPDGTRVALSMNVPRGVISLAGLEDYRIRVLTDADLGPEDPSPDVWDDLPSFDGIRPSWQPVAIEIELPADIAAVATAEAEALSDASDKAPTPIESPVSIFSAESTGVVDVQRAEPSPTPLPPTPEGTRLPTIPPPPTVPPTPTPAPTMPPSPTPTVAPTLAPPPVPTVASIAYVGDDGNVWMMAPDGSEQRQITTDAGGQVARYADPAWSHDGTMLVFAGHDAADQATGIWLYRNGEMSLLEGTGGCRRPVFSGDDTRVILSCWDASVGPDEAGQEGFLSSVALDGSDKQSHLDVPTGFTDPTSVGIDANAVEMATLQNLDVRASDGMVLVVTAYTMASEAGASEEPGVAMTVELFDGAFQPVGTIDTSGAASPDQVGPFGAAFDPSGETIITTVCARNCGPETVGNMMYMVEFDLDGRQIQVQAMPSQTTPDVIDRGPDGGEMVIVQEGQVSIYENFVEMVPLVAGTDPAWQPVPAELALP